ncbi:site-specific integrase [Paenibacillus sp. PK1-4R]|uniref:site-specific integrase n=1 Tax=Paenibacillus sp. PK1-4R TaxID=3049075 RepID=UPI0025A20423|nr:site-specific integrase [Paenibacillus sp. PK1-4R]WJM05878.1 site-specific integrase [Paenibacillus sp. PK1-4R]
MESENIVEKDWYKKLFGIVDKEILHLKNVNDDYLWDILNKQSLNYIYKYCLESPWLNQFSLAVLCATDRELSPASINNMMSILNKRLKEIFDAFDLVNIEDLNYTHFHQYLSGQIYEDHTNRQRQMLISYYKSFLYNVSKWLKNRIELERQEHFSKFLFPEFPFDNRDYKARDLAVTSAQKKRKEETSAVTPMLPDIRAQSHFRWNQIKRLREITNKMIAKVENEKIFLPFSFDYEESEYLNERLYFTLNKNSDDEYYLEFIKSINLLDGSKGEGLWFFEILNNRLLGAWSNLASDERKTEGISFLEKWGHDISANIHPFQSRNEGVLTQGFQLTRKQQYNTSRLFINVEPLYIACMFAILSLDIQSYSGARINEILQVSYDPECCIITEDKSIKPTKRNYILRLIPKGRDLLENYYMPESVFQTILMIIKELKSHYNSNTLPAVDYSISSRKHLMNEKRKFVFQYNNQHINQFTLNSVIRFLTHGLIIQTEEGKQVILKTHLLRHAFATHAAQTEKLPIDIVRKLLHQKDESVTSYYAAPTNIQISGTIESLHDNWMSYIDIQQGIQRSPEEIKDIYEEYKEKVGTVSKVVGGICTIDSVCPTKMACMGCAAKVPQPEFKYEIEQYHTWAQESEKRFLELGLEVEAKKMKLAMRRAKIELKEIEGIEMYIKDESYEPNIQFQKEN